MNNPAETIHTRAANPREKPLETPPKPPEPSGCFPAMPRAPNRRSPVFNMPGQRWKRDFPSCPKLSCLPKIAPCLLGRAREAREALSVWMGVSQHPCSASCYSKKQFPWAPKYFFFFFLLSSFLWTHPRNNLKAGRRC